MIYLLGCAPTPMDAHGTVVNARGGAPVAEIDLLLTPSESTCEPVRTRTDAKGEWSAAGLCGDARWTVAPVDPLWYLPEAAAAGGELRAWRAPPSPGVYLLAGTALTTLVTHTVLDSATVRGTAEAVRFPVEIPGELPRVVDGVTVLVVGEALPDLAFAPLVPCAERRWFGSEGSLRPVDPWTYLGVRFLSDTDVERVEVALDPVGVERVGGERRLRYISESALPPGRYALPTDDGARAWLVDFGPPS